MSDLFTKDVILMSFLYIAGSIQSLVFSNPGVIKSGIFLVLLAQSYFIVLLIMKMTGDTTISDHKKWYGLSALALLGASICTTIIYSTIDLGDEKENKSKKFKNFLHAAGGLLVAVGMLQYSSIASITNKLPVRFNNLQIDKIKKASIVFSYLAVGILGILTNEIRKYKRYMIPSD